MQDHAWGHVRVWRRSESLRKQPSTQTSSQRPSQGSIWMVTLAFGNFPSFKSTFGYSQGTVAAGFGTIGGAIVALIFLFKWKTEFCARVIRAILKPFSERISEKVISVFRSLVAGLTQTTAPRDIAWIVFLSLMMWVISAFTVYINIVAFDKFLTADETIILMMGIIIAVAIPAAPGYVGTYHWLAKTVLIGYVHIPESTAVLMAVVIHASNYIPQTVIGLTRFAYEGIKLEELKGLQKK